MPLYGHPDTVELADIVEPSFLHAVHEVFSEETNLASGILSPPPKIVPITYEFKHCDFCKEIRKHSDGLDTCRRSDLKAMQTAGKAFHSNGNRIEPYFYVCQHGLVDFCAPIVADNKIIAYLLGGQFRCSDPSVITPDEPNLNDLRDTISQTKTHDIIKLYDNMSVYGSNEFAEYKEKVKSLAEEINAIVQKLAEWRNVPMFIDFMHKAATITTVDKLFELLIDSLPDMIDAGHCSIFTVEGDNADQNEKFLVLRKTSFENLKSEEDQAYYTCGQGITGWVWKNACSLRLTNIQDDAERRAIDPELKWEQKYDDSDEHTSFLCVPMIGHQQNVIGVIRVPHKNTGAFTRRDQIFLEFLAKYVSWVMEYQVEEDRYRRYQHLLRQAGRTFSAKKREDIYESLADCVESLFGVPSETTIFVNSHQPGSQSWTIGKTRGGLAQNDGLKGNKHHITEGLSGKVIREKKECLLFDLPAAEKKKEYIPAAPNGKSAMCAPLKYGDDIYGAVGVVSEKKFAFTREKDLALLKDIGEMGGYKLAHTQSKLGRFIMTIYKYACWVWKFARNIAGQ